MKVPKAKQLPSGSWRVQVMVDGVRKSVTADTEEEAVIKGIQLQAGMIENSAPGINLSVGKAIDRYIENKDAVLSPSTIAGYKRLRKNCINPIADVPVKSLSKEQVQKWVNKMAKDKKSPKTIRNAHGLLSAMLAEYRPDMVLRTTLPLRQKPEINIPDEKQISIIVQAAKGNRSELPILLAIWLGLRQSEIVGLQWDAIQDGKMHIKRAVVQGEHGAVEKGTKTTSSDRWLNIPDYIQILIDAQPRINDNVIQLTGAMIYKDFVTLCKENGLPHFRFHDLRHTNASVMLALGVPDKYSMARTGHSTDNMLKTVYQHTMKEKADEVAEQLDTYFLEKLHTDLHTDS